MKDTRKKKKRGLKAESYGGFTLNVGVGYKMQQRKGQRDEGNKGPRI